MTVACCYTKLKSSRQFRGTAAKNTRQRPARRLLIVRVSAMIDTHPSPRILAIEPDPQSGAVLYGVLDKRVCADVEIVGDIDAALTSIAEQVPDLIMTSTFLAPAALARLIDELRQLPDAAHTQIITTPHFLDAPDGEPSDDESDRVLRFRRQRTDVAQFPRAAALLGTQIEHYLEQARSLHVAAQNRLQRGLGPTTALVPVARPADPWQPSIGSPALRVATAQDLRALNSLRPADRRRASRRRAADLAGQWGVRLTPGGDARIVDISCSGVRLETSTRLQPGNVIDLEVIGIEGGAVAVGARLIRTETVDADGPDVKYRSAAMFLHEIDLFAPNANPVMVAAAAASSYTPKTLADLLSRVLADVPWLSNGRKLWSIFESEVCALVKAKEVRIRALPMAAAGGCQSLYFRIPSAAASGYGLHVLFEPGYRPTPDEFRLLKAAASLASVVLDLAPAGEAPSISRSTEYDSRGQL
jgi:hypothetical protein